MKPVYLLILLAGVALFASCGKSSVSKIPHIALTYFGPSDPNATKITVKDTAVLVFSLTDGDADLGAGDDIFIKDLRFESAGFQPYPFPPIPGEILDPSKGVEGVCTFLFSRLIFPRADSMHALRDTTHFDVYIMDKAGNKSNIITTPDIIVTP